MRLSSVAILTLATIGIGESQMAIASYVAEPVGMEAAVVPIDSSTVADDLLITSDREVNESDRTQSIEDGALVRDIQIRFVDRKGETVNGRTRPEFLRGLLRLKPGDVFRESALESDLRRLRRLEIVDRVDVSVRSDNSNVDIIYDIKESRFPSLTYGGGYNSDIGIYGSLSYRDANIGGNNQQFTGKLQVSQIDAQFDVQYTDPYRASEPNRLGYSVRAFRRRGFSPTFNEDVDLPNDDDPREGRFGGSVALLRSFNDWNGSLGLNYTRTSIRDDKWRISPVDVFGNPLSLSGEGIDDVVTVSLGVSRDMRDRRSNPTSGYILSLSTEQSVPIGLGNALFNRLRANYIQYVPVSLIGKGRPTEYPELTEMVAFNLQAGTVIGDFPPAEAFNIGGLNSIRGYGGGEVSSGRSYVLASIEYRFPIIWRVGGVVFADFGSDLGSADTVLGEPAVIRDKPGSGFGYGLGLRVKSPIGLIRADFGLNDQGDSSFQITTGQRF